MLLSVRCLNLFVSSNFDSFPGGGDTVTAVHQLGYADEIPTLSTGGGACLHLLKGKKLPGFEALSPPDVNDAKQREDDVCKK